MYELVRGREVPDALAITDAFTEVLTSRGEVEPDEDVLGDGIAFAGVAKYPARVKCALLAWMAFKDALTRTGGTLDHDASTERHDAAIGELQ
jgi:nitrogen fixation NifU-like protein